MTEAPGPPAPRRFARPPSPQMAALVAGLAVVLIAALIALTQGLGRPTGQASATGSNTPAGSADGGGSGSGALTGSNGVPGASGSSAGPGGSAAPGSTGGPGASEPGGLATPGPGQTGLTPGSSPPPSAPGAASAPGTTASPPTHEPGAVAFVDRTRSRAAMIDDLAGAIHQQASAEHWGNVRDLAGEMADIAVGEAFWLDIHPPTACYADAHEDAAATWPAIEGLADAIDQAARGHDRDEIENQLTVVDFAVTRLRRYARDATDC